MPRTTKKVARFYGTGKRKTAVAKVWLLPGGGKITINDKPWEEYLGPRKLYEILLRQPLEATKLINRYDIVVKAKGGGISSQAGAIRHGIARAILQIDPDFRPVLRKAGYLTRDPRVKERKKYGRKRARKSFQFSKR